MAKTRKNGKKRKVRRRKFGQFLFRGDCWYLRVRVDDEQHSFALDPDEAESILMAARIEARYLKTGQLFEMPAPPPPPESTMPTLREYWESIEQERRMRMKPDGFRALQSGVRRALPYLGDARIDQIRRRDLKRLRLEYRTDRPVTPRTANSLVRAVSSVLSDAVEDEVIDANPALGLKALPVWAADVRPKFYPTLDDLEAVVAHCCDDLRDLAYVSFDTRLRRKDLHDADWDHVDWDVAPYGRIAIPDSKTGRVHFGWLTLRARRILEARFATRPPLRFRPHRNPIFLGWQAWRISKISRGFTAAAIKAGYDGEVQPRFIFHDLCRGFYRVLKQLGVRRAVREAAAGHAPGSQATKQYDDFMPIAEIEEGVEAMSEFIDSQPDQRTGAG